MPHHERWDGTGYPRGLKADEIPLGARIVSVMNTLETITSDQPYRTAQPFSAAHEEIVRWSGRQFDPDVVKIFLTIPESIWHELRKGIDQQIDVESVQRSKFRDGSSLVVERVLLALRGHAEVLCGGNRC